VSIKHWRGFPVSRENECRTIKHHSARVARVSFPRNDADIKPGESNCEDAHRPPRTVPGRMRHRADHSAEGTCASAILDPSMTS
jgi:hypothetical protein